MYNLQDIEDKIFFECKNILDSLAKVNSKDELLVKQELFYEVSERIAFLKVLSKNNSFFETEEVTERFDTQNLTPISESYSDMTTDYVAEDAMEEEVLFTNQLNDIDADEIEVENPNNAGEYSVALEVEDEISEPYEKEVEPLVDEVDDELIQEETNENISQFIIDSEPVFSFVSEIKDEETLEEEPIQQEELEAVYDDNNSVEFSSEPVLAEISVNDEPVQMNEPELLEEKRMVVETHVSEHQDVEVPGSVEQADGKLKLANIKSLKNIESLFDDEHFEAVAPVSTQAPAGTSTVAEINQTARHLTELKLDLNDKLAFSKMLFNGSQADLNDTIRILNSIQDVEQAKIYLSDLYYDRNWDKVDDYAQRLWTLVENKFL